MSKEKTDDVASLTSRVNDLEGQVAALRRKYLELLAKARNFNEIANVGLEQLLADRERLAWECDKTKEKLAILHTVDLANGRYSQSDLDGYTLATPHSIISVNCESDPTLYVTVAVLIEQTDRRCQLIQAAAGLLQRARQSRLRAFFDKAVGKEPYPFER